MATHRYTICIINLCEMNETYRQSKQNNVSIQVHLVYTLLYYQTFTFVGHCVCPPAPVNGLITNCTGSAEFGFLISYQCTEGYILQGNGSRECLPGGNWTGVDPTCFG